MVAAALCQAFIRPDRVLASQTLRHAADQLQPIWPPIAAFLDDNETGVRLCLDVPEQQRSKRRSINLSERLNPDVERRADVASIFANEASMHRLIRAVLLEQNDEWRLQHRSILLKVIAALVGTASEVAARQIACAA